MDGIIFDLDGTLWDSTTEVAKCWNIILERDTDTGRVLAKEELMAHFGKPMEMIMDELFPEIEENLRGKVLKNLCEYENEWVKTAPCNIYEGVVAGIKELASRMPIFIVSNCQAGYIESFLENSKLKPYITDHTCPGDTGMLKGDNIKLIMERNQLRNIVYVGDTSGDEKACKEANVPMIYASYGFGEVEAPYLIIDKFSQLLELDILA